NVEVEQNRAPAVLPHHADLARKTAGQPGSRGRTDRIHNDQIRPGRALRTGHVRLSEGNQGQRRGNGHAQYRGGCVPSGLELYDLTQTTDMTPLFLGVA